MTTTRWRHGAITVPIRGVGPETGLPVLNDSGAPQLAAEDAAVLTPGLAQRPTSVLPYDAQSAYDRDIREEQLPTIELENEHLHAVFLPTLGGRLWSLTDLDTGRELLHQPDVLTHANLALRNAWFAGGVEWNLGFTGHWPLTSSPVNAGVVETDGDPVIRFWEYERMLGLTWRIDVSLPSGSRSLFVQPRLENPTDRTVPVYWWSNIAVPQVEHSRVLVSASRAWHFGYSGRLHDVGVPTWDGDDISYPTRAQSSADYFFKVENTERPWITALDEAGTGLIQTSTSQLTGRKLFLWGTGAGGERWQEWLSGQGRYLEIQAGLASTQLEHLPLPPGEIWAWTETYGPITVEASDAHSDNWNQAVEAAESALEASSPQANLQDEDQRLRALATAPVAILRTSDSGWGALEIAAGHRAGNAATPYESGSDTAFWTQFLETGRLPQDATGWEATVTGPEWLERLSSIAEPNWVESLHLGNNLWAAGRRDVARDVWLSSLESGNAHPLTLRALAISHDLLGKEDTAADYALKAAEAGSENPHLVIEMASLLSKNGRHAEVLRIAEGADWAGNGTGRGQLLAARAQLELGELDAAKASLAERIIEPADLREGDNTLETLWADLQAALGTNDPLPAEYDFRMHRDEPAPTHDLPVKEKVLP